MLTQGEFNIVILSVSLHSVFVYKRLPYIQFLFLIGHGNRLFVTVFHHLLILK